MPAVSDEKERVGWLTSSLNSAKNSKTDSDLSRLGVHYKTGAVEADDCAVIDVTSPISIVPGTDYVRGPKFHLYEEGYLGDREIGRYCVTANASDLAAMGAVGGGFMSVIRYPKDFSDDRFREVMLGVDEACEQYGLRLLGGDTGSAERLILTGSVIGFCPIGQALVRSSARPGDVVVVTRAVGGAGAAVLASAEGLVPSLRDDTWADLLRCWTGFNAQMEAGRTLAASGVRIACQDVSDGLQATARELARASDVSIVLDLRKIPVHDGVKEVVSAIERRTTSKDRGATATPTPEALAISASTDFCLCFTCPPEHLDSVFDRLANTGITPHVVGTCEEGSGVWINDGKGDRLSAPGVEWRHQQGDIGSVVLDGLNRLNQKG